MLVKSMRPSRAWCAEEHPQHPTGDALDEVVAVEERAAVDGEEAHPRRRRARRRDRRTGRDARPSPASAAARSCAQSISIALATSVATTPSSASSSTPKRQLGLALDREHPHELAQHHGRDRHLALRAREPGQRDLAPGRLTAALLVDPAHAARVRQHVPQVAHPHRLGALGHHADHAFAHAHLGPDAFGLVAVAGDRVEPLARLVDEQQQRVRVAERARRAR